MLWYWHCWRNGGILNAGNLCNDWLFYLCVVIMAAYSNIFSITWLQTTYRLLVVSNVVAPEGLYRLPSVIIGMAFPYLLCITINLGYIRPYGNDLSYQLLTVTIIFWNTVLHSLLTYSWPINDYLLYYWQWRPWWWRRRLCRWLSVLPVASW